MPDIIDPQLFEIVVAVSGALGGWMLKVIWDAVKDLQKADRDLAEKVNTVGVDLTEKVSRVETLVLGEYVKHDQLSAVVGALSDAIFKRFDRFEDNIGHKVDRLETKLDGKVDKQ